MKKIIYHILKNLTPDLLKKQYKKQKCAVAGHCYIASEAAYHLFAKEDGFKPFHINHEGISHWFLQSQYQILDLTASQFKTKVPYIKAISKGFLTKNPSKRALILINRVLSETNVQN